MEKSIYFWAGREFNANGEPSPWWTSSISYEWDCSRQVFIVCTEQTFGTGTVENTVPYKVKLKDCNELNKLIQGFRDMEAHCKKVYNK